MELTDIERTRVAKAAMRGDMMPDGPSLERFTTLDFAQAIEHELERCALTGWTHIKIDLTLDDAAALASAMRRLSLLGL